MSRSTVSLKNPTRKTHERRTARFFDAAVYHVTLGSLDKTLREDRRTNTYQGVIVSRHQDIKHRIGALIDHVSFCDSIAFVRVILRTPESVVPES